MPRLWLRPEILEHAILHFASKSNASLTISNVHSAVCKLREENMSITKFATWQEVAREIFHWSEIETKIFWEFLQFSLPPHAKIEASSPRDELVAPLDYLALFLYIHIDDHHHHKTRESLDSFNTVWYGDEQMQHESPPRSPGSSSHSLRAKERSLADAHQLAFVKEHLQDILYMLFPEQLLAENMEVAMLSSEDIDVLGFIIAGGNDFLSQVSNLSTLYPMWMNGGGLHAQKESAVKIIKWLRSKLTVNELIHPPTGFTRVRSVSEDAMSDHDIRLSNDSDDVIHLHRPLVIQGIGKATFIKTAENVESIGERDLIISSCYDAYIYLPMPFRYISLAGCTNCVVAVGPVQYVATMDRCEGMQLSIVCSRLRVSNCLDSTISVYTTRSPVLTGDNRGIRFGPYNTWYSSLEEHLAITGFSVSEYAGEWCNFINLEAEDADCSISEREAVTLLPPKSYHDLVIPVNVEGGTYQNPFRIPEEYAKIVKERLERIEWLRKEMHSDELNFQTRKLLDIAIQANFKEWLMQSGNIRQISDLVELHKASKNNS